MAIKRAAKKGIDALETTRLRARYNAAEQQYSLLLQQRLQELLQGRRSALALVRRYPNDPCRLGVMATPPALARSKLRLPVVDALAQDTIDFVRLKAAGGPISQQVGPDGSVTEHQTFPTKFPHMVITRTDRYNGDDREPVDITWRIERLQNQRAQTHANRLLGAASLLLELVRFAG